MDLESEFHAISVGEAFGVKTPYTGVIDSERARAGELRQPAVWCFYGGRLEG